jgi:hypothetical protein
VTKSLVAVLWGQPPPPAEPEIRLAPPRLMFIVAANYGYQINGAPWSPAAVYAAVTTIMQRGRLNSHTSAAIFAAKNEC